MRPRKVAPSYRMSYSFGKTLSISWIHFSYLIEARAEAVLSLIFQRQQRELPPANTPYLGCRVHHIKKRSTEKGGEFFFFLLLPQAMLAAPDHSGYKSG